MNASQPPVKPQLAATLVLVHGTAQRGVVLMGIRNAALSFMPGAAVFPGGRLEPGESPAQAARRELTEETGLTLEELQPQSELINFGRAVTPAFVHRRFDTQFFAALVANPVPPKAGDAELEALNWYDPKQIQHLPTMGITERALRAARVALSNPQEFTFHDLNNQA